MNLNKFTEKAQEAVLAAQRLAEEYNHSEIRPSHLLLALLRQEGGVVPQIVRHLGANPDSLAQLLETELQSEAKVYGGSQPGLACACWQCASIRSAEWTGYRRALLLTGMQFSVPTSWTM